MSDWWNNSPYQPEDPDSRKPVSDEKPNPLPEEPIGNEPPTEDNFSWNVVTENKEEIPTESNQEPVSKPEFGGSLSDNMSDSPEPVSNPEPEKPTEPQSPQQPAWGAPQPQQPLWGNPQVPQEPRQYPPQPGQYPPTGQYPQSPYRGVQGQNWQQPPAPPQNPYSPYSQQPQNNQPGKKKKNNTAAIVIVILCFVCLACLAIGVAMLMDNKNGNNSGTDTSETSNGNANNSPSVVIQDTDIKDGGLSTAEIVQNNLDSTVVINMYSNSTITYGNFSFGNKTEEKLVGTASGIVMSEDGYIITNAHVVTNEDTNQPHARIEVVLYSGGRYSATVVGSDQDTDLAVIKIDATGLKAASFGDSDKINIGDRVVTLGNAGGLQWSASQGILSGKKRDVYDETGYSIQCLQIDAAINPGNSGGPLLNCMGQVIGINSAKIVYDGYENLGFSIPINEGKSIIDDFIRYGYVKGRVELGITGVTVTQEGYEGFLVYTIEEGSCLQGSGIQQYDIIQAINGTQTASRTELRNQLSKYKAGDKVQLSILRITDQRMGTTESLTVTVTLKEAKH